jgi:hypothetical protein
MNWNLRRSWVTVRCSSALLAVPTITIGGRTAAFSGGTYFFFAPR